MRLLEKIASLKKDRTVTDSVWNMLSTVSLRGSIFLINIIIAQMLGVELYGKYAFIKSTSQVFEFSLGIAFGISMTKFVAERMHKPDQSDLFGIIKSNLITSLLLSVVLVLLLEIFASSFLSSNINNVSDLFFLRISFLYLIFSNLSHSIIGILKGLQKFKLYFTVTMLVGSTNLISAYLFTSYFELAGAIIAFTSTAFFQLIILIVVIEKHIPIFKLILTKKIRFNHGVQKSFNIPALLSGLAAPPILWFLNYLLVKQPNGLAEVGKYNVGFLIFALLVFAPMAISDSLFPSINKIVENKSKFWLVIKKHVLVLFGISIFISMPSIIFPSKILLFFGEDFSDSSFLLQMFSIAAIFSSVLTYLGKVLAAMHLMWANLFFNFFWALLLLLISIINLNAGGAEWIAMSFIYSYASLFVIQATYIWYKLH